MVSERPQAKMRASEAGAATSNLWQPQEEGRSASLAKKANSPVHSTVVACEFPRLAKDGLTQLQLQKLVCYAHGWHLARFGAPLTTDHVEAWEYGPAFEGIWIRFKYFGNGAIMKSRPITDESLNQAQRRLV